jgi:hypothetical protein
VALIALTSGCRTAPEQASDAQLASLWLSATERGPGQQELVRQISERRTALEPIFIQAFNEGPSGEDMARLLEAVEYHWASLQVQLAEPEIYGLTAEEIAEMKSISLAEEKEQALGLLTYNYRAAALSGLGITSGAAARDLLTRTAAEPNSPFRLTAAAALKSTPLDKR